MRTALFKQQLDEMFDGQESSKSMLRVTLCRVVNEADIGCRVWNTVRSATGVDFVVDLLFEPGAVFLDGSDEAEAYLARMPWFADSYGMLFAPVADPDSARASQIPQTSAHSPSHASAAGKLE